MTGLAVDYRDKTRRISDYRPADYGLANALARKVRREFPSKTVEETAAAYGLTVNEARGVVFATASRRALDKALKTGGWSLGIELLADVIGQPLEQYIADQAERARRERITWEARERDHAARLATISSLGLGDRIAR